MTLGSLQVEKGSHGKMTDSSLPRGLLWPFRSTWDHCSPSIPVPEGQAGNLGWGVALPALEQGLETFPQERRLFPS